MDKQTIKVVAREFYKYLDNEKGAAFNTRRAYRGDVEDFVRFVSESSSDVVDHETIRAYIVHIYKGLKKSSLARKVSAIKMFFRFMKKKGYIDENTSLIIRSPRIEKHLPKFYTIDEMFHFLDFLPRDGWLNMRNRAIFELMYSSGMRASEVLAMDKEDLHLEGMWARVTGKGGKERVLPFGEKAKEALEEYLAAVGIMDKFAANTALFINFRGERLTYRGLLRIMKKHQIKAQLFKNLSLHGIRHSFATHMLDGGADLRVVQEMLGHESLSSTQIYTHVSVDRLKEVYRQAHPHA